MGKIPPHEGKDRKLLMVTSTKSAPQMKKPSEIHVFFVIAVVGWVGLGWVGLGWVGWVGLVGWLVGWLLACLVGWLVGWLVGLVGSGLASSLRAKLGDTTDGLMEGLLTEGEAPCQWPRGPAAGFNLRDVGSFREWLWPIFGHGKNFREDCYTMLCSDFDIIQATCLMQWGVSEKVFIRFRVSVPKKVP